MKKFGAILSVSAVLLASTGAFAGGPLTVQNESVPVVVRKSAGSGSGVGIAVAIAAVLFAVSASSGSHGSNVSQ